MVKSFLRAVLDNEATLDDISKYRHDWSQYKNNSEYIPCYAYLGLSLDEYISCRGGDDREVLAQIVEGKKTRTEWS